MKSTTGALRAEATTARVARFLEHSQETIAGLDQEVLVAMIECLIAVWRRRGTVYVMGNGGSASTASHFAADLAKYTIVAGKPRFKVLGLTDNAALVSAWTNDGGFGSIFAEQMVAWLQPGDALVGSSVDGGAGSGDAGLWSQNLVRAMQAAKDGGASVIAFSGFGGGAMAEMADFCLTVPVPKELLARLQTSFAYLVIDTPPVNAVTDAAILAADADATVLVVEDGKTTIPALRHAKASIERVGARRAGPIVNKMRPDSPGFTYYSYAYGVPSERNGRPRRRASAEARPRGAAPVDE